MSPKKLAAKSSGKDSAEPRRGEVWPVVFAIRELTPSAEARIAALLKKAIS
jgi:hypothetical protein